MPYIKQKSLDVIKYVSIEDKKIKFDLYQLATY